MGDMPFNIHENAIYGHPLGPHFSDNVRPLRHQLDRSDVASVEEVSQSRMMVRCRKVGAKNYNIGGKKSGKK